MGALDKVTPWSMLYVNLGLASLTLVTWLVVRVVHRLRPRWLSSVRPGMRWKFFFACFGLAVVALLASLIVGALLPHDPNAVSGKAHVPTGQLLATAIVILVTTPLQALGEEYGFRGYLMQAFGSFFGSRVAALLITATLFALAHGTQNFPLFFDRFAFGLMAGAVVILVGGLEAGIALHILNNLLAFGIAIAYNQLDSTLTVSEASWWQLPVTIAQNGVYLVLVLLLARRMGLRNVTAPPVADPAPQPVG
jgi:membrane protease YdiL (CAAX protease family)